MAIQFLPIKTRKLLPPQDDLLQALNQACLKLQDGDVLLISSKVLAIHQGRCVKKTSNKNQKRNLIKQEADLLLPETLQGSQEIILTIKDSTLIPSAGIDESNANGYFILWPQQTNELCRNICKTFKKQFKLKKLAVIATDSHTTPLRRGVTGIATGFFGLEPVVDLRGSKDLFGRKLKVTTVNIPDALSAMAVLLMGEGNEQTPALIIRGAKFVKFTNKPTHAKLVMDPKTDLYHPILKRFSAKGISAKK